MKKYLARLTFICVFTVMLVVMLVFTSCESKGADKPENNNACTHESFGEWTTVKLATCEQDGQRMRKCNNCIKTETEAIAATGHSFSTYVPNGDATCASDGTKTAICDNGCDKTDVKTDTGTQKSHTGGTATCTEQKKCTVCLSPYGATIPHKFENYRSNNDAICINDGTKTAFCEYGCGQSSIVPDVGSATGVHIGGVATCSLPPRCELCFSYYGEADPTKHSLSTTVTAADCVTPSRQVTQCANCSYNVTVDLAPATGHTLTSYKVKSQAPVPLAKCTYSITLVGNCSKCNTSDAETVKQEVIHEYVASISEDATCVRQGTKSYKCKNCEKAPHTQAYTDLTAHSWEKNGEQVSGVQAYKCSNIGCTSSKNVIEVSSSTHTLDKGVLGGNELKLGDISVKLDNQTVGQLEQNEVTLTAKKLNATDRNSVTANLTAEQKAVLGNKPVFDFIMLNGNAVIDEFSGEVTVTVPYQLGDEDPDCIAVWYISEQGSIETISASYSNGFATFKTTHFSSYSVVSVAPEHACDVYGHSLEQGVTAVLPTCTSIGYSVKVCNRCNISVADVTSSELGHLFGNDPDKTEPTCDAPGEYVYTCQRSGCGHIQKINLPIKHDWQHVEYVSPNCQEDGYTDYKCSKCLDTKRTVEEKSEAYHDIKYLYKLKDGAQECIDGVINYAICCIDGCEYYEEIQTFYTHIPVEKGDGEPVIPEEITVSFNEDFQALSNGNPYFNVSVFIMKSTCACGKANTYIEFRDEGNHFGSLSGTWIYGSEVPSEDSCEVYTCSMGPMMGDFNIAIVRRVDIQGCVNYFYVDVITNYQTDQEKTYEYYVTSSINHTPRAEARLKKENTNCSDGIIVKQVCLQCQTVISETEHSVQGGKHYYTYDFQPAIDLSSYSGSGHKMLIKEGRCPCGQSEYLVTHQDNAIYSQICDFKLKNTVTETDGTVKKTYGCTCGIKYMTAENTAKILECTTRRYKMIYYGTYDEESNSFDKSTGLKTHVDTYSHQHELREKSRNEIGSCYVERVTNYFCKYCSFEFPGFERESVIYEHDLIAVTQIDSLGNKTVSESCSKCGYEREIVTDKDGNAVKDYSVTFNPKTEKKTICTIIYCMRDGMQVESFSKNEIYTFDGESISWEQKIYLYATVEDGDSLKFVYTVNSDGSTEFEQLYI